jgi:tRNA modification GTPase
LILLNKLDLVSPNVNRPPELPAISCKTEKGLGEFLVNLEGKLAELCANPLQEAPLITSSRQRHHVQLASEYLEKFLDIVEHQSDLALAGEYLRRSAKQLGSITARGKIDTEEMLDVLFRSFCIGK